MEDDNGISLHHKSYKSTGDLKLFLDELSLLPEFEIGETLAGPYSVIVFANFMDIAITIIQDEMYDCYIRLKKDNRDKISHLINEYKKYNQHYL